MTCPYPWSGRISVRSSSDPWSATIAVRSCSPPVDWSCSGCFAASQPIPTRPRLWQISQCAPLQSLLGRVVFLLSPPKQGIIINDSLIKVILRWTLISDYATLSMMKVHCILHIPYIISKVLSPGHFWVLWRGLLGTLLSRLPPRRSRQHLGKSWSEFCSSREILCS